MSTPCNWIYIWFQIQRHDSLSTLSGKPRDWSIAGWTCYMLPWKRALILMTHSDSTYEFDTVDVKQCMLPTHMDWSSPMNLWLVFHKSYICVSWPVCHIRVRLELIKGITTTHKWCDLGRPCTVHVSLSDRRCLALGTGLWYDPQDACHVP